jgi:hypothetical protein
MKEAPGTCGEAPGAGGVMLRRETKPFRSNLYLDD